LSQQIQNPKAFDYVQLFALSAIWGTSFLAIDIAILELSPLLVAFIRVFLAAIFLLTIIIYKKLSFPKDKKTWAILFLTGILNNAIPFFLISWGQQYINSSTAAIMLACGPFIALILSHYVTQDEKFSLLKLISVAFGFVGVFILIGGDLIEQNISAVYGQIAVFLATIGYISAGILIRKISHIKPIICATSMLITGSLAMLPFVLNEDISHITFSSPAFLAVVFLAILPTAIASLIRVELVQRVGVQFMSQVSYLIPVFAIFWAWLFLSELPKANALFALALILLGLFIKNIRKVK